MIWLAGHEDPAKKGIDTKVTLASLTDVLKACRENPVLKVREAFKTTAASIKSKTLDQTEAAKFQCFLINLMSAGGDDDATKTLVAWLSGQYAALAKENVFDFEKFKTETSAVSGYCKDVKNQNSDIGAALQAMRK